MGELQSDIFTKDVETERGEDLGYFKCQSAATTKKGKTVPIRLWYSIDYQLYPSLGDTRMREKYIVEPANTEVAQRISDFHIIQLLQKQTPLTFIFHLI